MAREGPVLAELEFRVAQRDFRVQSRRLTQATKYDVRMQELGGLGRDLVSQVQTRCKKSHLPKTSHKALRRRRRRQPNPPDKVAMGALWARTTR